MTATKTFKASVQYDDLVGTSAADRADDFRLEEFFESKGYISRENRDTVVAIEFWSGENHGKAHECTATLTVANLQGYENFDAYLADSNRPPLRSISVTMSNDEFFGHFKRFHVVLTHKGYEHDFTHSEFEVIEQFPE